ncbi:MAG TPA: amidohydrolase [Thermoanaerobaculia bacterium]
MRRSSLLVVLLLSAACTSTRNAPADLVLRGGRIFTGVEAAPWAEAVAIRGERIAAVGTAAEIARLVGTSTRVVELEGRVAIPGINDAHVHAPWFSEPTTAARPAQERATKEELLDAIRTAVAGAAEGSVIAAELPLHLVDAGLTRDDLDGISNTRPIRVAPLGGHSAILNTAALRAWGIAEEAKDPLGGWYGRGNDGRLNGWLYEHAYWMPQKQQAERASDEALRAAIREFEQEALRHGITSVQTYPIVGAARTEALLASIQPALRWRTIELRVPPYTSRAGTRGPVKYILDGTPIERSAAMQNAYADAPSMTGRLNYSAAEIEGMVRDAASGGGQLHVHAVGDRAIAAVLDAMERTKADWPSLRLRIEHGDTTTPELAARMRKLGVILVQNPSHFTIAETMHARYGERARQAQPARSLVAAGNRFALGSDGPLNPFLNMFFAAIHPTNAAESLTVGQSLRAYTEGAAFAELQEREKGRIAPGMLADMAVLSQDIFAVAPPELPKTRSVMTIVGGKVAWEE